MAETIDWSSYLRLQPKEAVDYLRKKGHKITFRYDEMQREEHAYHFTVAKAMTHDLLLDIRTAVDDAIANGTTLEDFKKTLTPTLQAKGWWGKKTMVDPNTGEEKLVQLGSPRRLKIIYDTNLRTAYAAGRWEQVERTKKTRPYLRYVAVMDERTREQHRHWHDVVKPVDDPFWDDHYPPNGWRCRCNVQQLNDRDLKRLGLDVTTTEPDGPPRSYVDKRTGETLRLPPGIDPSFGYNVGKARMRSITPPLLDRPLPLPFLGNPVDVPPPAPRSVNPERVLPDTLSSEEYASAFLKEFGGDIGKPVVFTDVTGEPVVISEDLFKTRSGAWKITKRGRGRYLLLLADSIKEPDEIMWSWGQDNQGQPQLYRSYMSRHLNEKEVPGFTLFAISKIGWSGLTSFTADDFKYLDRQRVGAIVYRRPDKK